jgi:glycosyltransferase involved in cell wall biosynthesis
MRVALVDPASYTPPYDHELAASVAARGHRVDLVTSAYLFDDAPPPQGYARHEVFFPLSGRLFRRAPRSPLRVPVKALEYGPSVALLLRCVAALDPDVVHVQWLPLPRVDVHWLRRLAARRPVVLTAHDVVPRRSGQLAGWKEALAAVARIVVQSQRGAEELGALGVERRRIALVRHPTFAAPPERRPPPPRGRTLLFFGLLRDYKGLDVLVAALPTIAERVTDARLVVAGDPLDPVESLRSLAERLGVAGRIDWRLRFIRDEEIPGLMEEATAVVLPYRRADGSGVLATALGHGRPAIVADVGSLGELVGEFGAGRVVPPGDPAALAVACAELLADPAALQEAAAGAADAARALSWEECARLHEQLYEEVASRHAR